MAASMLVHSIKGSLARKASILVPIIRQRVQYGHRYLLTPAYQCTDIWNERLSEPILQFNVSDYLAKMEEKIERKAVTGVDVNLLANRLSDCDATQLETAKLLFKKFRRTQNALHVLDSTPYALARSYIEVDQTDDLIEMLQDKLRYGIFLDPHGASILMDHFIKLENYLDASRVAYELMLQEDLKHPLSQVMALYSCHMNFKNPAVYEDDTDAADEQETAPEEGDGTITYMRVPFIRNPRYDDHFDITDEKLLLGKTLATLGRKIGGELGSNYQLVGWGLYEKFHEGLDVLKRCLGDNSSKLTNEAITVFRKHLEDVDVVEPEETNKRGYRKRVSQIMKDDYLAELETLTTSLRQNEQLTSNGLDDMVASYVKERLAEIEPEQIEEHREQLNEWNAIRRSKFEQQCTKEANAIRIQERILQLREMKEKEELLNYFQLKDDVDLAKSQAPKRKESIKEDRLEKSVQALIKDTEKTYRVRKERDNRRDHRHENREKYIAMKKIENRKR